MTALPTQLRFHSRLPIRSWHAFIAAASLVAACGGGGPAEEAVPEGEMPPEPTLVLEDFAVPPTPPWEWIRESPDAHRIGPKGLEILLQPGGLMGDGKDAKNILVRPLPEGAMSVLVNVEAHHQSQFEQAGLILYRDDDNYVKLVQEQVDGENWIVCITEIEAVDTLVGKTACPGPGALISLELDTNKVSAFYWPDADLSGEPIWLGDAEFPMHPRPRIGVFCQSGVDGADRWAAYRRFVISR